MKTGQMNIPLCLVLHRNAKPKFKGQEKINRRKKVIILTFKVTNEKLIGFIQKA